MTKTTLYSLSTLALYFCFSGVGCGTPPGDVSLDGEIYDGVTDKRLSNYKMSVLYRDKTLTGTVSTSGDFLVQNLPLFQDYTVQIDASGYRPFRSHNAGFNVPNAGSLSPIEGASQTFFYNAYLFPSNLVTPATTLSVMLGDVMMPAPKGTARLRPTTQSSIGLPNGLPAAVGMQVWLNDEDLQAQTLLINFTNGQVSIGAGQLVYGVTYAVDIYGVDGYAPLTGTVLRAGYDTTMLITLTSNAQLAVLTSNASTCLKPVVTDTVADAQLTIQFNQPVEFAMNTPSYDQIIDQDFSIQCGFGTCTGDVFNTTNRGSSATFINSNTTLQLSWNPSVGLTTKDPANPITSLNWNLSGVFVQPVGKPTLKQPLGDFVPPLPSTSIPCDH
jgi:hypothetical protein